MIIETDTTSPEERIVSPTEVEPDNTPSLRPQSIGDFVGQEKLKTNLTTCYK